MSIKWKKSFGLQVNRNNSIAKGTPEEFEKSESELSNEYAKCTEQTIVELSGEVTDEYDTCPFKDHDWCWIRIGQQRYRKQQLFEIIEDMTGETLLMKNGSRLQKRHCGKIFRVNARYYNDPLSTVLILGEKMVYMLAPLVDVSRREEDEI